MPRDKDGSPVPGGEDSEPGRRGRGHGRRGGPGDGRVPRARQLQGPPRRPAPDRDRDGRHPRRDPGPGLVLAREHRRLRADPPGQGRHAGLDAIEDRVGRRPRVHLEGQPPLPAPRRPPLHHRGEAPLRLRRGGRRAVPAGPLPGNHREPAGQGSPDQRRRAVRHLPQPRRSRARRRHPRPAAGPAQGEDRRRRQAQRHQAGRAARRHLHQARPEPLPARHPRRAAADRRRGRQVRGEPRRQVPAPRPPTRR